MTIRTGRNYPGSFNSDGPGGVAYIDIGITLNIHMVQKIILYIMKGRDVYIVDW